MKTLFTDFFSNKWCKYCIMIESVHIKGSQKDGSKERLKKEKKETTRKKVVNMKKGSRNMGNSFIV